MSGWTALASAGASRAGLEVGLGVHSVEQANAGDDADRKTKVEMRAAPARAAMATIGVRCRSRNEGW
jgi:hypothetical protein